MTTTVKIENSGVPGWLARVSVQLQLDHDLVVHEFEPCIGLCADSSEPGACFGFCQSLSLSLSLSLCPSPTHSMSLKTK